MAPATTKPVFRSGANIDRMVEQNERFRAAEDYARSIMIADKVAEWHTHQYRPLKCPMQRMNGYDPDMNTQATQEMHHKMALELKYAAKELVLSRRAKLKSLFENEALQYEAELNSMGLAVAKARD